jgi:hypothetical protein
MLIFNILGFLLVLISGISFALWQSSLTPIITQNFSAEKKEKYLSFFEKTSFLSLGACIILLIQFESIFYLDIWNIIFLGIAGFFISLFVQNLHKGRKLLTLETFKNRYSNYIITEFLLPYLFIFSWIKLLIILVTGNSH